MNWPLENGRELKTQSAPGSAGGFMHGGVGAQFNTRQSRGLTRLFRRQPLSPPSIGGSGRLGGFSLLEVILSLAILAGSLAALGEVVRQADRNASLSGDETQAQIIAASIMDDLLCGYRQLAAVSRNVYDPNLDEAWVFSIEIQTTQYTELLAVRVLVEQELDPQLQPVRFELVRWIMDPEALQQAAEQQAQQQEENESSSSGSSNGSSTTGSSTGSSSFGSGGGPP